MMLLNKIALMTSGAALICCIISISFGSWILSILHALLFIYNLRIGWNDEDDEI